MTSQVKRIAGGILAATLLTFGTRAFVTAPRWIPELKQAFSASAAPRTVSRLGWDYKGPDDPQSFQKDIASLDKDRPLVVMLYNPGCEMCEGLIGRLHEVKDKNLTALDFDVVQVNVQRYSQITWDMRQGNSTPECFIFCGDKKPVQMTDIPQSTPALADYLQKIYESRADHLHPAPGYPALTR